MQRREFLKRAGYFVATASVAPWLGCASNDETASTQASGAYLFPQGVASGDPQPDSIVLWTRALSATDSGAKVSLRLEVSTTDAFKMLVVTKNLAADSSSDHTVRVYVDGLAANTTYYYRFVAGGDVSRVGRTRTAPMPDDELEPRFAWVCCQDYVANYYSSYRRMLNDDMAASEDEQLQFILHIGDFIYETRGAGFMQATNDDLDPVALSSADGKPRNVPEFPSGGGTISDGVTFAQSVDDYRQLYQTYLKDPDLQDARARWPFIAVWDDHEFSDDCWQTQANYDRMSSTDEPSQPRRVAASQAWFEYVPSALSDFKAPGDVASAAKDFEFVQVEVAPYSGMTDDVDEPNNQMAINAITIYRNFRYGKHLELVLTDNRSYRADQALPEDVTYNNALIFDPRVALPKDAVIQFDAGREANGGKPLDMVDGLMNTHKDLPPGSLLGPTQKQWWKDVMQSSQATFKVWGNTVPLLRFVLDNTAVKDLIANPLVLSDDAWDGYNSERKELMGFLKDQSITNVVSLSGDHHAFFAGLVAADYDADTIEPVMVDVVTAGISSNSQWSAVAAALKNGYQGTLANLVAPVQALIYYDATQWGGPKAVVNLNTLIRYGSKSAAIAAQTNDTAQIEAARDPKVNAHLRLADSHAFGYGLAHVSADSVEVTLMSIQRVFEDKGKTSPDLRYTAKLSIPRVDQLSDLKLDEPDYTGTKPFPLT